MKTIICILFIVMAIHGYGQLSPIIPTNWNIPHLAADTNSFKTQIVLENRSSKDATFRIELKQDNGYFVEAIRVRLGQNERHLLTVTPEQLEAGARWARVRLSNDFNEGSHQVGVQYTPLNNDTQPSYVPAIRSESRSQSWRIYTGDWQQIYDGVAVVKDACSPGNIKLTQFDMTGQEIKSFTTENEYDERFLFDLSRHFDAIPGGYVEISSDLLLSVMGLKASRASDTPTSFIVGNQAIPHRPYEELRDQLSQNMTKWNQQRIFNYRMHMVRMDNGIAPISHQAIVEVRDGFVQSIESTEEGESIPGYLLSSFMSINEFNHFALELMNRPVGVLGMTFNEEYGYVERIFTTEYCTADYGPMWHVVSVDEVESEQ